MIQVTRSTSQLCPSQVFYMLADPLANDGVVSPGSRGISGARATPSAPRSIEFFSLALRRPRLASITNSEALVALTWRARDG